MKPTLTREEVISFLNYDPETGLFQWRYRPNERIQWNARYAGTVAGCTSREGYIMIGVCSRIYFAHRLVWLYMTGEWPKEAIDHINCQKADNRFANLREATVRQNNINIDKRKNNTSGYKGVHFNHRTNKWQSQIRAGGKQHYLGGFENKIDAAVAYQTAAKKHFGEFARTTPTPEGET